MLIKDFVFLAHDYYTAQELVPDLQDYKIRTNYERTEVTSARDRGDV
jgi:hypothetical protein